MASCIGAIDQGTTSTRFIVFDRTATIVAACQREHEQIYSKPGWVENDPEEIWQRTRQLIEENHAAAGPMAIAQGSESRKLNIGNTGKFVLADTWLKRGGSGKS